MPGTWAKEWVEGNRNTLSVMWLFFGNLFKYTGMDFGKIEILRYQDIVGRAISQYRNILIANETYV
jgi:hypothetical protein